MRYSYVGPADSWYEPDYVETPEDHGYIHEDDLPDLDHIKDYLEGVLEAVYVTGDVEVLENCLDEICGQFDLKLPVSEPVLRSLPKNDEFSKKIFNLGVALSRTKAALLN